MEKLSNAEAELKKALLTKTVCFDKSENSSLEKEHLLLAFTMLKWRSFKNMINKKWKLKAHSQV